MLFGSFYNCMSNDVNVHLTVRYVLERKMCVAFYQLGYLTDQQIKLNFCLFDNHILGKNPYNDVRK